MRGWCTRKPSMTSSLGSSLATWWVANFPSKRCAGYQAWVAKTSTSQVSPKAANCWRLKLAARGWAAFGKRFVMMRTRNVALATRELGHVEDLVHPQQLEDGEGLVSCTNNFELGADSPAAFVERHDRGDA